MNADLTSDRLREFIEIADPTWMRTQLISYEEFRRRYSYSGTWSHRLPSISPVVPLLYWSSREPYEPTNEIPMGYWAGEPKSILGRLVVKLLEFKEYWEDLPEGRGIKNIRWSLQSPQRFAGFEHEIRTASGYRLSTPYKVEPRFFDPSSKSGEPDIILTKGRQTFNVQCKSMDPSASSSMSFENFLYMSGRMARISQDHNIHSYLSVSVKRHLQQPIKQKDVDAILVEIQRTLKHGLTVTGQQKAKGYDFVFRHHSGTEQAPINAPNLFVMWSGSYQFREIRSVSSRLHHSNQLTVMCEVIGGRIPNFENYVYPKLEETAKKAPKGTPNIICLHLYPPVPVHEDPVIQNKVMADLGHFFDRHRHVCLVLLSSYAQKPFSVGGGRQTIGTPAWELESQHWKGERPDYDPSASLEL